MDWFSPAAYAVHRRIMQGDGTFAVTSKTQGYSGPVDESPEAVERAFWRILGLTPPPEDTTKRGRATTRTTEAEVLALRDRGLVPSAIADALNLSDRRVRSILAKHRKATG